MWIDLHVHEKTFSRDSFLSLGEIAAIARQRGLDAVCVTDHDSMGLKSYAEEFSRQTGFPVFVGVEYYSLQGDILAFGISDFPKERIPAQDFIDQVHRDGGAVVAAHPFRHNRRGLEGNLDTLTGVDALEVLNGSTLPDAAMQAVRYVHRYGFGATGGSDCHYPHTVGTAVTWFPEPIRTMEELVRGIRSHSCRPGFSQDFKCHIWDLDHLVCD